MSECAYDSSHTERQRAPVVRQSVAADSETSMILASNAGTSTYVDTSPALGLSAAVGGVPAIFERVPLTTEQIVTFKKVLFIDIATFCLPLLCVTGTIRRVI